jgi:hypothetical protein
MKWLLPAAIVLVTSVVGIIPAWREQQHAINRVAMVTCAEDVGNEAAGSPSQTLRFQLAEEVAGADLGITADQLVALGFDRADSALLGASKPPTGRWPSPRPAWARLRPDSSRGGRLVVEELGTSRAGVRRDSTSIVARVRVGWSFRPLPDFVATRDSAPNPRQQLDHRVMRFGVLELMPAALHITAAQDRAIRQVKAAFECRGSTTRAVIANGPAGGLWIERVVSQ